MVSAAVSRYASDDGMRDSFPRDNRSIPSTAVRYTRDEWLAFIKQIDKETPDRLALHPRWQLLHPQADGVRHEFLESPTGFRAATWKVYAGSGRPCGGRLKTMEASDSELMARLACGDDLR